MLRRIGQFEIDVEPLEPVGVEIGPRLARKAERKAHPVAAQALEQRRRRRLPVFRGSVRPRRDGKRANGAAVVEYDLDRTEHAAQGLDVEASPVPRQGAEFFVLGFLSHGPILPSD